MPADQLEYFIKHQMRMSHIYQPVMLKVLLENGGQATTEEIAKSLLAYDQSQVEYYSLRTKAMVGKVLTNNGVVEPIKEGRQITGYRLRQEIHTEAQRAALQGMCESALLIHRQAWRGLMEPPRGRQWLCVR